MGMKIKSQNSLKSARNITEKARQNSSISGLSRALILSLGLSSLMLSGCSYLAPYKTPLTQGNVMKQEAIDSLQEGLNKDQVRLLLGPPLAQHPFQPNHWEYVFYTNNPDLHSDSAKHLVIQFDEDQLLKAWAMRDEEVEIEQDKPWLGLF